jgi:hypothetical protein
MQVRTSMCTNNGIRRAQHARMKYLALVMALGACATEPDPFEEASQEINFPPEEELEILVRQYCAMSRDGVTTYKGLSGTYQRMGLTGIDEPVRLTLATTQDDPSVKGTFTGTYSTSTVGTASYAGRFGAIPDNPAIGAAFALDVNSDGEYDKLYFVLAIRRSFGQVRGLCLAGADHPFLMSRSYF